MPMSKQKMPDDVRRTCIELVKGYERRVREYRVKRMQIIDGAPCQYEVIKDLDDPDDWKKTERFYPPSSHSASRTGEDKVMQLQKLEELPETKRMRAVERAKEQIGLDLPKELRKALAEAIWLNCKSGRRYPYTCFYLPGIEKTNFYDRRSIFLYAIASYLNLV